MKIATVWLRTHVRSQTAHAFDDYLDGRKFLSAMSFCGERRDESMRIVANLHDHRICMRCSGIHTRRLRREAEHAAAQALYGEERRHDP